VPQSRSGHGGEEKNSQPPPGIEPLWLLGYCHQYKSIFMLASCLQFYSIDIINHNKTCTRFIDLTCNTVAEPDGLTTLIPNPATG